MKRKFHLSFFIVTLSLVIIFSLQPAFPSSTVNTNYHQIRLAVFYFDNESITDKEELEHLRKGIADSLISALHRMPRIQIVERERIEALFSEFKLNQSGLVDLETSQKLGKILGVQVMLLGSYSAIGDSIRIDTRIVDVETGQVLNAEEVTGSITDFFDLERSLINKIESGLRLSSNQEEKSAMEKRLPRSFPALTEYSKGLDYLDKRKFELAKKQFEKVLMIDPKYPGALERIDEIKQKAKQKYIVAVLPFEYSKTSSANSACASMAALVSDGLDGIAGITVTDRARIKRILDMLQLAEARDTSNATDLKASRLLGANVLVLGSCHLMVDQWRITVKMIWTETGGIIASNNFVCNLENPSITGQEIVRYIGKSLKNHSERR